MKAPVTRDPRDPAFPHGTPAGRQRGCTTDCPATPTCTEARARQMKHNALMRDRGQGGYIDATDALRHANWLREQVHAATFRSIEQIAGISNSTFTRMQSTRRASRTTVNRILAVTPEALAEHLDRHHTDDLLHMIRTMQAAGFPVTWQAQRAGTENLPNWLAHDRVRAFAPGYLYRPIRALFDSLDGRLADPALDGISPRAVAHAKSCGARAGYYPAGYYDEDGNLNPRFIPDHPWTLLDELCGQALEVAYDLTRVREGYSLKAVSETHGWDQKRVERMWTEDLGLYSHTPGKPGIHRDCAPIVARIRSVYGAYEDGKIGPVTAALALDLYQRKWLGEQYDHDHPELRQEAHAA